MNLWPSLAAALLAFGLLAAVHRSGREYPWAGMGRRRAAELSGIVLASWLIIFAIGWATCVALAQVWHL